MVQLIAYGVSVAHGWHQNAVFAFFEPPTGSSRIRSGCSGARAVLGPPAESIHDGWASQAIGGGVRTNSHSVMHHERSCLQPPFTSAVSPPVYGRPSAKFDRCFYLVYDELHTRVLPDDPSSQRALGSHVATTAGRCRRGCGDAGAVQRTAHAVSARCASRVRSASLGLCAGHVSGASHTPTRNAKPCQKSDGSRPPAALGSPHSDQRSDQIRSTYPLRGPGRVQVSDSIPQHC